MENSDNKKEVPTMGNLGTIKGTKWEDINRNGVRDRKVVSEEIELVNNLTQGYYNSAIEDLYPGNPSDPLASYFTGPNISTGAPTADFSIEPDLSSINELENWLNDPESAIENGFWSNLQSIPRKWAVNTETAIIYEVDGGEFGVENLIADFVVDNSILVWVNGEYRFGIGNPPGFRANDVSLGNLNPGKNYIQIIRSDYGLATNYGVNITGDLIEIEEPGLSGISIYLDSNNNKVLDNGEAVRVTAADDPTTPNIDETGQYEFNNLEPGTYIVREVIPDGFEQTFPLNKLGENVIVNGSFEEDIADPALDNVSVKPITTNSDNHVVNLTEGEVVTDINFGNVVNSEKVKAPFSGGPSAVKTSKSYDGLVEIDITGTGQAAGASFSDGFYRFTDNNGNQITPALANEFGLYINGEPAEILFSPSQSVPSYSSNNSYNFIIDAPGGVLTFGVGDTFITDNTGFYDITIQAI